MKSKYYLLISVFTLIAQFINAQSIGDYRSATTGNYITLSTWQRFNGTSWVTPTVAQGWPGQTTGTGNVTIQSGHTISIGTGGLSTQPMNLFTIQNNGQLYLTGTNNGQTFGINTPELRINLGGSIFFFNKATLILPLNSAIVVSTNGLIGDGCNANKEIVIGQRTFAQCQGGPSSVYSFNQLMTAGGTILALPDSNSPLCPGNTINLLGDYSGAIGTTPTYSWSVTNPVGVTTVFNTQNVSIPNAISGIYTATLTVSTVLSGQTYSNAKTISVIVNTTPTLSNATQPVTTCSGFPATIQLSGLVPNTTFQLTYNVAGGSPVTVNNIVANSAGNASFETIALTPANNGNTLQITQIVITNLATNCTAIFNQNVTLSVWTTGGGTWTGRINNNWHEAGNWCSGVPTATTNVYIPAPSVSVPNQPLISAGNAVCMNMLIETGASLTISGNSTLDVKGNWNNQGTFVAGIGTVSLTGIITQNVSGNNIFNNLTVNNIAGIIAGGNITVNGVLNLASANPDATRGSIEMTKNYGDYSNVKTPSELLTTRRTESWDILDSWILYMGANATTIGQGDVTGKVKRTNIAENVEYSFGSQFSTITFNRNNTGTLPNDIMFVITKGPERGIHANKTNAVERLYQIIRTGGTEPTTFSIKLRYLENELNGNEKEKLVLWDHHIPYNSTNTPHEHGQSSNSLTENWVSLIGHGISYLNSGEIIGGSTKYWMLNNSIIVGNQWLGAAFNDWTNWNNPSNWSAGNVPISTDNVIIPSASLVPYAPVLPANATVGTITIREGGVLNGESGTLTINKGIAINGGAGSWNNNGTFNAGNSTVIFSYTKTTNAETSTISGNTTFNDLTINAGTYLVIQVDAHVNIVGNITKSGFMDAASHRNTFEYSGSNAQTVVNPDFGNSGYFNLILSGAGTKTLAESTMNIRGNVFFNAPVIATNNNIELNGNSLQHISGDVQPLLNKLTINNQHGVTITTGVGVSTELSLINGLITTGSNLLTIECTGSITGGSANSYISGKLARRYCSVGAKTFPIGKVGAYRPLTLKYTSLTGTSTVVVEQFESTITGTMPVNVFTQSDRHWQISQSGGSAITFDITLDGTPFDVETTDARIVSGDGVTNSAFQATVDSYQFTASSLNSFGNFAVAVECVAPVITNQPLAQTACYGSDALFTVTTSTPGVTYQWQVKTNPEAAFVNLINSETIIGVNTATLNIKSVQSEFNGYQYRVVINRNCGNITNSNEVSLTVNTLPTITLISSSTTTCTNNTTAHLAFSETTENPTHYLVVYSEDAVASGFINNPTPIALGASPLMLSIPVGATGTFAGYVIVSNANNCVSEPVPFTVTINALPQGSFSGNTICANTFGMLKWSATSGTGPFTVIYHDGQAERTVSNIQSGVPFSTYNTVNSSSQFTLVSVTGSDGCSRSTAFTQGTATVSVSTGIWIGGVSTDWHNAANWCGGVPDNTTDVLIPGDAERMPIIGAAANTRDLNIGNAASVVISGNFQLNVNGKLTLFGELDLGLGILSYPNESVITNHGTIYTQRLETAGLPSNKNWGDGMVEFNALSGTQQLVAGTFGDIMINNPGGEIHIAENADVKVEFRLSINSGTLIIDTNRKVEATNIRNLSGPSGIFITGSSETHPNGTLIFFNDVDDTVEGTVQMYSRAAASTVVNGNFSNFRWQFFGIPIRSVVANPTFHNSFVRRYNETVLRPASQWITLNNTSVLESFIPYQITQRVARYVYFRGILENRNKNIQLTFTPGGNFPGQNLIANPYQASLDITQLSFGDAAEKTVYLFNTGSFADWNEVSGVPGENPGQYTAIPVNIADPTIPGGLPREIPSMQGFLLRKLVQDNSNLENFTLGINYRNAAIKSTRPQRVRSIQTNEIACMIIQASDDKNYDKLWLYDVPGCTRDFDNGWDGWKTGGPAHVPLIYSEEASGFYQVNSVDNFDGSWLTFRSGESTNYSLKFTFFNMTKYENYKILLTDTHTNEVVDVTADSTEYFFTATPHTTQNKRFLISTVFETNAPDISTWTGALSNEWNLADNWSNGTPGTITNIIIANVSHQPVITGTVSCADITILSNSRLTISNGGTLNINGNLLLESNEHGTATMVNQGTLTVSGTTTMQQYLASDRNWYISSPFSDALAPAGFSYFEYREPGDNTGFVAPASAFWKSIFAGESLQAGKGYIARPVTSPTILSLSGTLNNADVTLNMTRTAGRNNEGFNLAGNPYPAFLNINSIMSNPDILKSFWLRGRNSSNTAWIFDSYNIAGGVATRNSGLAVTNLIAPMQSFWVRVASNRTTGTLTFNNAMQTHQDVSNNRFRVNASINPLIRLQVSNGTNSDETVIYFNQNASDGYDAFDSPKMFNNNPAVPEIFTRVENERLAINGMSRYFGRLQIPLGFVTGQNNSFTIHANEIRNFNPDIQIILIDNHQNTEFNLTLGETYSFTSAAISTQERFVVMFKSLADVTFNDENSAANIFVTAVQDKLILQISNEISDANATIYNATGQVLHTQPITNGLTVLNKSLKPGMYIVKIKNSGKVNVLRTLIH